MGECYKTPYIPECDTCTGEATYEVCDERNRTLGHYCLACADKKLGELRAYGRAVEQLDTGGKNE